MGLEMRCDFIRHNHLPPISFQRLAEYFGLEYSEALRRPSRLRLPTNLPVPRGSTEINRRNYGLISQAFKEHVQHCHAVRKAELLRMSNVDARRAKKLVKKEFEADMRDMGFPLHANGLAWLQVYTYFLAHKAALIPPYVERQRQGPRPATPVPIGPVSPVSPSNGGYGPVRPSVDNTVIWENNSPELPVISELERQANIMAERTSTGEGEIIDFHNDFTQMPANVREIYALCEKADNELGMPVALLDKSILKLNRQQLILISQNRRYFRYSACFESSRYILDIIHHMCNLA